MENAPRLKITDVRTPSLRTIEEVGALEPAWNPGGSMGFRKGGGSYVEIHTDQGLVGIGPAVDPNLLPAVKSQLVGKDPFEMEGHVAALR